MTWMRFEPPISDLPDSERTLQPLCHRVLEQRQGVLGGRVRGGGGLASVELNIMGGLPLFKGNPNVF